MLVPVDDQDLPPGKYSKKKFLFNCSCGNSNVLIPWNSYSVGKAKTCGECKLFEFKKNGQVTFGRLTLKNPINELESLNKPTEWTCECGNTTKVNVYKIISGNTRSCGCLYSNKRDFFIKRSPKRPAEEWLKEVPELIGTNLPEKWSRKAGFKTEFRCSCGRIFTCQFNNFTSGRSKCGLCNYVEVFRGQEINGFIYDDEAVLIKTNAHHKYYFLCNNSDCRRRTLIESVEIFSGQRKSCGKCDLYPADFFIGKKFGKLIMKEPKEYFKFSTKKANFICDCGNETSPSVGHVINGISKSCGKCGERPQKWFRENENILRNLHCPIEIKDFPVGGLTPTETIKVASIPFVAICPSCQNEFKPRFGDVRLGVSLTCGCTTNRISSYHWEIFEFCRNFDSDVKNEFKVNNLSYDIFIPSKKLLIEFNGLKWHSFDDSKRKDISKWRNAISNGYHFLSIYEDEWIFKRPKFEQLIKNKLNVSEFISFRPSKCETRSIGSKDADPFYEQHHYIGACKAKINYGVFYQNQLIACASFKRPTRQSSHDWELVRMTSHPNFRIHGIWSKLIKQFVEDHKPKSVVSFSDNRLFTGSVYEKIGFKFDGNVDPDYYWCKGQRRFHKSGLRKTEEEKLSGKIEAELREAQGYRKIWDLGKKRWIFQISY